MCNAHNHPPGCTCGWGGVGHSGGNYGGHVWPQHAYRAPVAAPPIRNYRLSEQEFTSPSRCPKCDKDVFFIRHNGGSVWVDELGWPWPKHPCFDTPAEPTRVFSVWTAKSSGFTNPKLAMIVGIKIQPQPTEPLLELRMTDAAEVSVVLRYQPATASMLGALVVVSEEDGILLLPNHGEVAFHSLRQVQQAPPQPKTAKAKPGSLEQRVQAAIDSIARGVWESLGHITHPGEQFKEAKQEALKRIARLSPHIKRQVGHRFTSSKWLLLLEAKPNPKPRPTDSSFW